MLKAVLSGLLLSALISVPTFAQNADVVQGKMLYMSHCSGCHLPNGAGGVHFGEAVSANLRAPGLECTYHHNSSLLLRAILEAKDENGQRLDPPMPAWKGRLSPAEALDIVAYLKTLRS